MSQVFTGDALEVLRTLEGESVHLTVTSPPYDDLRTYCGGTWHFGMIAQELFRVTRPGGVLCWIVGDSVVDGSETLTSFKQAIYFVETVGFKMHDTMIYHKTNFGHPEKTRYHSLFEYIFVLSKGKPTTFNPIKDKPNAYAGTGTVGKNSHRERDGSMTERKRNIITEFGMRGNVWTGITRGQEEMGNSLPHPAMMPKWLARDLILSWSNKGDTVLDPFAGSGTVPVIAKRLEREYIAIDISGKYVSELIEPSLASINPLWGASR